MSSTLVDRTRAAMTAARKNRDGDKTLLYSTLLSDFGNRAIELGHDLTEAEEIDVVRRAIKRRKESVEAYSKAGRTDLESREQAEITELEPYLPPAVDESEIRSAIKAAIAAGAKDLGGVMGQVMPSLKGRADGKLINSIAREELAG